jgi:L-threonylcarbamoyladenylate synthase
VTAILRVDPRTPAPDAIARAAEVIRRGGLVAFPTETVYGLGAHALDPAAVRRIFAAKGRPATDPLIVHVTSVERMAPLVADIPEAARTLALRFWPGPLTLVLPRSRSVPDEVTAGLDTVAVRVPAHPVARALLAAAAIPIAAPSANLFSRPSPTRAAHVLEDLDGRIDLVIDGGPTTVGVESTVLDLSRGVPTILRPGVVTLEMLEEVLPGVIRGGAVAHTSTGPMASPGLMAKHYSPRAALTLYEGDASSVAARIAEDAVAELARGHLVGIVAADEDSFEGAHVVRLGSEQDLAGVAARLYAALRELDAAGVDVILVRGFPALSGLGVAIADRLRRAAAGRVVRC